VIAFARRHRIFLAIAGVGAVARLIAVLGYHPALWFSDSLGYAALGTYPYPAVIRPSGYPLLLLYPLHWFHSFMLVVIVQHLLGLGAGVLIYTVLLRRGVSRWAAALASAPMLLAAYEIQIEHFILSDPLFIFLLVAVMAVLLWNPSPGWLACAAAGVLLGTAAIVRTEGLPLIAALAIWLAIQRGARWGRVARVALVCAAFAMPVATYAVWFHESYGHYKLTYSSGPFLAARAESFASCPRDHIPDADSWLCTTTGHRPDWYLWSSTEPLHSRVGEFSQATDKSGTSFARHVIEAQPVDYVVTTWRDVLQNFTAGQTWHPFVFPGRAEPLHQLLAANPGNPATPIYRYDSRPGTRLSQPWADIMQAYQQIAVVPPVATAVIVLAGAAGLALCRERRGGYGLLPWLMGIALLVFPAATSGYGARYELAAIAPLCLAAVLGMREITGTVSVPSSRPVEAT
jgi:Dolichyl-phosphate-mannose-protein mannosyltransferase